MTDFAPNPGEHDPIINGGLIIDGEMAELLRRMAATSSDSHARDLDELTELRIHISGLVAAEAVLEDRVNDRAHSADSARRELLDRMKDPNSGVPPLEAAAWRFAFIGKTLVNPAGVPFYVDKAREYNARFKELDRLAQDPDILLFARRQGSQTLVQGAGMPLEPVVDRSFVIHVREGDETIERYFVLDELNNAVRSVDDLTDARIATLLASPNDRSNRFLAIGNSHLMRAVVDQLAGLQVLDITQADKKTDLLLEVAASAKQLGITLESEAASSWLQTQRNVVVRACALRHARAILQNEAVPRNRRMNQFNITPEELKEELKKIATEASE